jgi:hypothetical protein
MSSHKNKVSFLWMLTPKFLYAILLGVVKDKSSKQNFRIPPYIDHDIASCQGGA